MADEKPEIIFDNNRQALKVRFVFWLLLAAGMGGLWAGWSILLYFGLSPGDGGVLRPLWQRLLFGGSLAVLGGTVAYGMWIYIHLYVLRIALQGSEVAVTTMAPFGRTETVYNPVDLGEGAFHDGKVSALDGASAAFSVPRVDAPWMTLRVRGRFWPLIVDVQAEVIDFGQIGVLAEGKRDEQRASGNTNPD